MNPKIRIIALILLFFLGISAVGGGIGLIIDPTGISQRIPLSMLEHSPFEDFLIPGIILLVMNGLLSILFAILVIGKTSLSGWLVLIQGCILLGWLLTQIAMIRDYDLLLHTLYLAVGVGLAILGILMILRKK
jgi:hypothetical protein